MNWTIICIAIIAASVGIIWYFKTRKGKGKTKTLPVKMPKSFDYSYPTPFGVMIYSVVAIPEDKKSAVFAAVENGINTQIITSSRHNPTWDKARSLEDYRVAFIEPEATNQDGSPALLYNGRIQTAGTVLGVGRDGYSPIIIVLPHQQNQGWAHLQYLAESARNESEHWAESQNDEAMFYRFAVENDFHPHWE